MRPAWRPRVFDADFPCARFTCSGLADLVHFCEANSVALDFLSTHSYPTDPPNGRWSGGAGKQADTPHQLLAMQFAAKQAQQLGKPLWITEWSSDPGSRSPYHDTTDTAAYIVSSVASVRSLGLVAYSYWTFSDVFEEGGIPGKNTPFHGGFGMINLYDVPKPSMRAFQLLNMLSDAEATATLSGGSAPPASLTVLATVATGANVTVLLANHDCSGCADPSSVEIGWVTVTAAGFVVKQVSIARIDANTTNPHAAWLALGAPNYPTPAQQVELVAAAQLKFSLAELATAPDGNPGVSSVVVPPHAVVALVFSA